MANRSCLDLSKWLTWGNCIGYWKLAIVHFVSACLVRIGLIASHVWPFSLYSGTLESHAKSNGPANTGSGNNFIKNRITHNASNPLIKSHAIVSFRFISFRLFIRNVWNAWPLDRPMKQCRNNSKQLILNGDSRCQRIYMPSLILIRCHNQLLLWTTTARLTLQFLFSFTFFSAALWIFQSEKWNGVWRYHFVGVIALDVGIHKPHDVLIFVMR